MTTITDAIDRSRSHDEIVHVTVEDTAQAIREAQRIAEASGLECDWAQGNDRHEVWAYEPGALEGEMVWRVHLEARDG